MASRRSFHSSWWMCQRTEFARSSHWESCRNARLAPLASRNSRRLRPIVDRHTDGGSVFVAIAKGGNMAATATRIDQEILEHEKQYWEASKNPAGKELENLTADNFTFVMSEGITNFTRREFVDMMRK